MILSKDFVSIKFDGRIVKFKWDNQEDFLPLVRLIIETFVSGQYFELLATNCDYIVDIGANIGDSLLLFALNNKKVIAYEPFPRMYNKAVENIRVDRLCENIAILNQGISTTSQFVKIKPNSNNYGGLRIVENPHGTDLVITSIGNLFSPIPSNNTGLKIDCEGCGYDLSLKSDAKTFEEVLFIVLEYHYGYKNLEEKLKPMGFSVTHSRPISSTNFEIGEKIDTGIIIAKKVKIKIVDQSLAPIKNN